MITNEHIKNRIMVSKYCRRDFKFQCGKIRHILMNLKKFAPCDVQKKERNSIRSFL